LYSKTRICLEFHQIQFSTARFLIRLNSFILANILKSMPRFGLGATEDTDRSLGRNVATTGRAFQDLRFHSAIGFAIPQVHFQHLLLKFLVRDARAFLNKFEQGLTHQSHLFMPLHQFLTKTLGLVGASSDILCFLLVDADLLGVMSV